MLIFCDFIQVYVFTTNHNLQGAGRNAGGEIKKVVIQCNNFLGRNAL